MKLLERIINKIRYGSIKNLSIIDFCNENSNQSAEMGKIYEPLLTEEITAEMYNAPDIFDYSAESAYRHIQSIKNANREILETDLCMTKGYSPAQLTVKQYNEITKDIKDMQRRGLVDLMYDYTGK